MNTDGGNIQEAIRRSIVQTICDFRNKPHLFLTEEDLRCHLFRRLHERSILSEESQNADGNITIPLHAEVRWYGDNGRLKVRTDIVIICTSDLKTLNGVNFKLPSKGYGFNKYYAIVEIKLRRINGKSDSVLISDVKKDIRKLLQLKESASSQILTAQYYVLVLDHKKRINDFMEKVCSGVLKAQRPIVYYQPKN